MRLKPLVKYFAGRCFAGRSWALMTRTVAFAPLERGHGGKHVHFNNQSHFLAVA